MTYWPRAYAPRHSAVLDVENRYRDIPSLRRKLDAYFAYWPQYSVDFWRDLQDVAGRSACTQRGLTDPSTKEQT